MATVNLGRIKPVFRGAYSGSTAYVVDDIVTSGGSSYICIQAHGAGTQAVTQTAYWTQMAAGGTDVGTTITTQGDILYRDASGLQRLAAGTSGYYLETKGSGQNPVWSEVTAKFVKAQYFAYNTRQAIGTGSSDINLWSWGNFNKQSATSKLYYHGYLHGAETENDISFIKFTATPSSGSAETDQHGLTHGAHTNSVNAQMSNLTGKFDTAFATGNVDLSLVLSSDGQANRGKGADGMIFNPNNSDDARHPSTATGSHLVVYEIED